MAKLTQRAAGGQGGSEGPVFPLIPHCDLSGQAEWPATYLGHGLGPGVGSRDRDRTSTGAEWGWGGSAQNTKAVKRLEF